MRRIPRRTIFLLIAGFALLAAVLPILAGISGVITGSRREVADAAADAVASTGRQIAARLARGLGEQWREHQAIARFAVTEGMSSSLALRLDTAKALNDRLAWLGIAAPDGRVLLASGRVLEGQDVSARPWFRAGLQGPFAGDVHEAMLLQRILRPDPNAEPLRLIDFAAPLRRPDGSTIGVLGSHIEWNWVRRLVRESPLPVGSDAMLLARDGTVLVGPPDLEGKRLAQRTALAGSQGVALTTQEEWPDGRRYLTAVVPVTGEGGPASFGWSLVLRQQPETATRSMARLAQSLITPVALASAVILLAGLLLARSIGRPAAALARAAAALAEGRLDGPAPETRSTRELALISAALARLDRQHGPPDPPADRPRVEMAAAHSETAP